MRHGCGPHYGGEHHEQPTAVLPLNSIIITDHNVYQAQEPPNTGLLFIFGFKALGPVIVNFFIRLCKILNQYTGPSFSSAISSSSLPASKSFKSGRDAPIFPCMSPYIPAVLNTTRSICFSRLAKVRTRLVIGFCYFGSTLCAINFVKSSACNPQNFQDARTLSYSEKSLFTMPEIRKFF